VVESIPSKHEALEFKPQYHQKNLNNDKPYSHYSNY
jgi:hypothetical protein